MVLGQVGKIGRMHLEGCVVDEHIDPSLLLDRIPVGAFFFFFFGSTCSVSVPEGAMSKLNAEM